MMFLQKCLSLTLILFAINIPAFAQSQATASASVSDNQVVLGDIFILMVEVNNTGSEYQLDTSELKNKFTVFLPTKNQKRTYINGDYNTQTTWQVRLQANKVGTFIIPALKVGDAETQAITIQVNEVNTQKKSIQGDAIFIENAINKSEIYLGQKILLETKIYISEVITNANILHPTINSAEVEQINPQEQTQIIRNGKRYQVFSYQYEITPTIAKKMVIPSPLLTGQKERRVNQWQGQSSYQAINIRGNETTITAKEIPANFDGDWLVSEDVRLIENNDLHNQEYSVGDPITRSISLLVADIAIDKMPEIKLNYNNYMRFYPDKDDLKKGNSNNKLYTQRTVTHAIIASKAGELVLPEIKIPWWNSVKDQQEFATLPPQTLTIKAAQSNNTNKQPNSETSIGNTNIEQVNLNAADNQTIQNTNELYLWRISTAVLLVLLSIGAFYHLQQRRLLSSLLLNDNKNVSNVKNNKQPYKALLTALQGAKPELVYNCLLRYLQFKYPAMTQLQDIQRYSQLDGDKKDKLLLNIKQLELACAGQPHQWNAPELNTLIKQEHQSTNNDELNTLSDLNP